MRFPRQAKIENFCGLAERNKKVRWLDVAVDDPIRVCRVQGIRDVYAEVEHRFDPQRLARDHMP